MRRSPVLLASLVALPMALVAGVLTFWHLGGFAAPPPPPATGPVAVAMPPSSDPRCSALVAGLPGELAGAKARPVSGAVSRAGAWGDPAVVLRCGVAKPVVDPAAQLLIIEGISWTTAQTGAAVVWTSTSLPVPVEIRVPDTYRDRAATQILNPLAKPIKNALS